MLNKWVKQNCLESLICCSEQTYYTLAAMSSRYDSEVSLSSPTWKQKMGIPSYVLRWYVDFIHSCYISQCSSRIDVVCCPIWPLHPFSHTCRLQCWPDWQSAGTEKCLSDQWAKHQMHTEPSWFQIFEDPQLPYPRIAPPSARIWLSDCVRPEASSAKKSLTLSAFNDRIICFLIVAYSVIGL